MPDEELTLGQRLARLVKIGFQAIRDKTEERKEAGSPVGLDLAGGEVTAFFKALVDREPDSELLWWEAIPASMIPFLGLAFFMDFIGEEALQTMSMAIWVQIQAGEFEGAQKTLGTFDRLIEEVQSLHNTIGAINPIGSKVFQANLDAVKAQREAFERVINKKPDKTSGKGLFDMR